MKQIKGNFVPQALNNTSSLPAVSASRPLRVALFGFGTVGSSVARILLESHPAGLELSHIFNRNVARKRVDWVPDSVVWTENAEDVLQASSSNGGPDVIVELAGGLDPAGNWVRTALANGKSVVTANKKLIAYHGLELEAQAAAQGLHLLYGAAVAGGIPVIPGLEHGLAGDRVDRVEGILNGTCNFILSKMQEGGDYAETLAEAQQLGYAEADPTEDVAGYDARAKLSILTRLALRAQIHPEEIPTRSITDVSAIDFSYARDLNCTVRQIARAGRIDGELAAVVGPMLVPLSSPLAWSRGTENMVVTTGHYGGDVVFSGHGAGGHPTAVAVVSDLVGLAQGSCRIALPSTPAKVSTELEVPHYIRFTVSDRPGIVAAIAGALARENINLNAILQRPGFPLDRLPFVITVEPCRTSALQRALKEIARLPALLEPPLDMQILEK
ncbi:homoserine dehydrogenase [Acidicapsa dinghuensis]|uniref:Homoserine dehydrogenase n=1 Tax=Acidicapsa dinghuensis TaxID=2218256 RepID=A0ABW1EIK5_9BACT|nr:homoserine dehydrogenase [Acidicapsa dinghuensis]